MPRKKNLKAGDPEWHHEWLLQQKEGADKEQLVRQKARRLYDKMGIDRKGKQIDHVKPLAEGGSSAKSNLHLTTVKANESKNLHHKGERGKKK